MALPPRRCARAGATSGHRRSAPRRFRARARRPNGSDRAPRPRDRPCALRGRVPWNSWRGARVHEALWLLGSAPEEIFLHLAHQELARLRLEGHEPVLVDQHRLVPEPLLPGFLRDVLEDALPELTRIRRPLEAFRLAAELHAVDHSGHLSTPRAILPRARAIRPPPGRQVRASALRLLQPAPLPRRRRLPRARSGGRNASTRAGRVRAVAPASRRRTARQERRWRTRRPETLGASTARPRCRAAGGARAAPGRPPARTRHAPSARRAARAASRAAWCRYAPQHAPRSRPPAGSACRQDLRGCRPSRRDP